MSNGSIIHADHRKRMRDRIKRESAFSIEDHEILEVFLFDVIPRRNTNDTAHLLLEKFGTLKGVFSASVEELTKVKGIGKVTAEYIVNSYSEFSDECEKYFRGYRMISFELLSNYLLYHRHRNNISGFTVIVMHDGLEIVEVFDVEDFKDVPPSAYDGCRVIIASDSERVSVFKDIDLENAELVDIVSVDGFCVKSLRSFPLENELN